MWRRMVKIADSLDGVTALLFVGLSVASGFEKKWNESLAWSLAASYAFQTWRMVRAAAAAKPPNAGAN